MERTKAPFKLPVEKDDELLMLRINGKLNASLIIGDVNEWDAEMRLAYLNYIFKSINSHAELLEALELHGQHLCTCSISRGLTALCCDCGLDEAIAKATK